jgi:hypothetical protein
VHGKNNKFKLNGLGSKNHYFFHPKKGQKEINKAIVGRDGLGANGWGHHSPGRQ